MAGYYIPLVGTPQIGDSGGGGSGLPAVTAADNGDVLTVVNGAWDKAAPSGGGLLVTVTTQDDISTCDKTAGEIMAVAEAAGSVVFKTEDDGDYMYMPLGRAAIASGEYRFSDGVRNYTADSADDYPTAGGIQ